MQRVPGGTRAGRRAGRTVPALLALVLAGGLSGCGGPKLACRWQDREIRIDGDPAEWRGTFHALDDERLLIGLANDGKHLCLCLGTADQALKRQILMGGLTLWFDPTGGEEKVVGLRFPLGARAMGLTPTEGGGELDQEAVVHALEDPGAEIEILRGDQPAARMFAAQAARLEVHAALREGTLVYELSLPLSTEDDPSPIGLESVAGQTIGIGFDAGAPFGPRLEGMRPGQQGRGEGGGGFPGDGRSPGGGMGRVGRPGGGRGGRPEPLQIWTKVQLATEPDSAQS